MKQLWKKLLTKRQAIRVNGRCSILEAETIAALMQDAEDVEY